LYRFDRAADPEAERLGPGEEPIDFVNTSLIECLHFVTTFGPVAQVKSAVPRGDGDRGTPLRHLRDPFHTAPAAVSLEVRR
jgi:hypothetical protein